MPNVWPSMIMPRLMCRLWGTPLFFGIFMEFSIDFKVIWSYLYSRLKGRTPLRRLRAINVKAGRSTRADKHLGVVVRMEDSCRTQQKLSWPTSIRFRKLKHNRHLFRGRGVRMPATSCDPRRSEAMTMHLRLERWKLALSKLCGQLKLQDAIRDSALNGWEWGFNGGTRGPEGSGGLFFGRMIHRPHPATEGLATFPSALLRYGRDDANQQEGKYVRWIDRWWETSFGLGNSS